MHKIVAVPSVEFITTAEVAALAGKDRSVITRLVQKGKLRPVMRLEGKRGAYLFDRAEVEAFIERQAS